MKYIKGLEKALKKAIAEQDEHPLSGSAARKVAMLRREINYQYNKSADSEASPVCTGYDTMEGNYCNLVLH